MTLNTAEFRADEAAQTHIATCVCDACVEWRRMFPGFEEETDDTEEEEELIMDVASLPNSYGTKSGLPNLDDYDDVPLNAYGISVSEFYESDEEEDL